MRTRRIIALIATMAVALLSVGFLIGLAAPAQAASCTKKTGTAKTDPNTGWSWTTWWICGNDGGAAMYADANAGTLIGYMDSTSSWFVCWRSGAQHAGGNNIWYYSQGDRASAGQSARHAWGFMPAVNVYTSTDPWPGMAQCPASPPSTTPSTTSTPSVPTRSNGYKTVILLHGYEVSGSVNCNDYWGSGSVESYLNSQGWAGKVVKATYYSAGGAGCTVRIPGAADRSRPIDELGADFAWYVYNNYSRYGLPVDVIAHSMGGLVTRVAIAGTATRRTTGTGRAFPPYVYIEDVATLSSPHEGIRYLATMGCANDTTEQCAEMVPGNGFLNTWILITNGSRVGYDNPQSAMGTDWSAVGSGADLVVNTGSALNVSATYHFGHKYIYMSAGDLGHGDMSDISGGSYPMRFCDWTSSCDMTNWANWTQLDAAHGPLWVAANAVYYSGTW